MILESLAFGFVAMFLSTLATASLAVLVIALHEILPKKYGDIMYEILGTNV